MQKYLDHILEANQIDQQIALNLEAIKRLHEHNRALRKQKWTVLAPLVKLLKSAKLVRKIFGGTPEIKAPAGKRSIVVVTVRRVDLRDESTAQQSQMFPSVSLDHLRDMHLDHQPGAWATGPAFPEGFNVSEFLMNPRYDPFNKK